MVSLLAIAVVIIGIMMYINTRSKKKEEPKNIVWKYSPMIFVLGSREEAIFNLLNIECVKRGRKPYKADFNIGIKAFDRVLEMDLSDKIDHSESHDELLELKIDGSDGSADLISKYFSTPKAVVGKEAVLDDKGNVIKKGCGWFGSKKHKAAIMNPRYDYCGIGSLLRENNRWIDDLMLVDEKTVN